MTTREAKVEVLTAEVRVLMVGSRQITLSVYSQLDEVNDALIEPFGRVRPRNANPGYIYLIGKHSATGALIRASVPVAEDSIRTAIPGAWDLDQELRKHLMLSRRHETDAENIESIRTGGIPNPKYIEEARTNREQAAEQQRIAADLKKQYEELAEPHRETARNVAKLPLIVLAGLR